MKQNKYDDASFFTKYSQMSRSVDGLEAAGEWPELQALLPDLQDKRVLDLGCGFGWHCRYAREMGAQSVVGIDLSENMIARAIATTNDSAITYQRMAIEDINFPANSFDIVFSSLAMHYVEHFAVACQKVHQCLVDGGAFILSVEHPIFTARAEQDWYYSTQGERLHWPVDNYQAEGLRQARFLDHDVIKYHRTLSTYLNTIISAGFNIRKLSEPQPTLEMLEKVPAMRDEVRRPIFLVIAAEKSNL